MSAQGRQYSQNIWGNRSATRLGLFFFAAWTLVCSAVLVWTYTREHSHAEAFALLEAKSNFNKDLVFRRWATRHGGVYVTPDERTPPNPYLSHIPNRDLTTTDGQHLTLMNPAYMMRQMTEEFEEMYGIKGRITGLKQLNPINSPDAWERSAIESFQAGERQVVAVAQINGRPFLRFMKPIFMTQGCVKCHSILGYKDGDLRGGVSVSIPLTDYYEEADTEIVNTAVITSGLWLAVSLALFLGVRKRNEFVIQQIFAEEALQKSESKFRTLVETQPDAVFINQAGKLAFLNPSAVKLFGGNGEEELLGQSVLNFVHPNDQKFAEERIKEVFEQGKSSQPGAARFKRADGSFINVEITATKAEWHGPDSIQVIARDVSDRILIENQLAQSQKMEAVGQLTGGVAHDFNNLLQTIQGNLEIIELDLDPDMQASQNVKAAISAVNRGAALTQQLLAFSRTQTLFPVSVNIVDLINNMVDLLRRTLGESVELRTDLPEELLFTFVDPNKLQNALLNLALNAKAAMPQGGSILIQARRHILHDQKKSRGSDLESGDYVKIDFSDTGIGMNAEVLERAVEPFYTTKGVGEGSGLGLSMVYGFVRQSQGDMSIESKLDLGTKITLLLPATDEATTDDLHEVERPVHSHGEETILVVEDDAAVRKVTVKILEKQGYKILEASNGIDAIEILNKHSDIDLLFSDVVMPQGMSGVELANTAIAKIENLEILLTSGYPKHELEQSGLKNTNFRLIKKPYANAFLLETLREIFS